MYINSEKQNLTLPILSDVKHGRTLYPFRDLLEALGAVVSWDAVTRTAVGEFNGSTVKFPLGSTTYYINDTAYTMDTKTIIDPTVNRTYIPIRYAFEAFGYTVQWIESQKHDEIRIYNLGEFSSMSDEDFLAKVFNADHTSNQYYDFDTVNRRLVFKDEYGSIPFTDKVVSEE